MDSIEILNKLKTDKNLDLIEDDYWANKENQVKTYFGKHGKYDGTRPGDWSEWKDQGPFSYEEAFKYRLFPEEEDIADTFQPNFIKPELYNKKFKVGDFEISVSYKKWTEDQFDERDVTRSYYRFFHRVYEQWSVYANYHGAYILLGRYRKTYSIQANKCTPEQNNWFYIKPSLKKPFIMENVLVTCEKECFSFLKDFFKNLNIKNLETFNIEIVFQDWYDSNIKGKKLFHYSLDEKDAEWFISSETSDGIYRPERVTIDRWLLTPTGDYKNPNTIATKYDKNLFKKLNIHTVQLRADAHFNVPKHFNMTGVKIKAPQKVIEKYSLTKYCKEEKVVAKIKSDEKKRKEEYEALQHNNKFTLTQHGKILFTNVDREKIIDFLETFVPSSKTNSNKVKSYDDTIIETVKPIFDEFEKVKIYYIAYWGRYFKYECAGEICEICYEVDEENLKHIDKDTYDQIQQLYADETTPDLDDKIVKKNYGWPERGGLILGVKRVGKELKVFTEKYDFE